MTNAELLSYDLKHLWHPCSQMKDYEKFTPLIISKTYGSYLELADGQKIIDAISSWWCKTLGHNHPQLKAALIQQLDKFEHVILANTTNETIVKLSQQLSQLMPGLNKVCYASDGSSAVEIAIKMSLHARVISNENKRKNFMALQNSFHGETLAALSVSDLGLYKKPYEALLFQPYFITEIPYVTGIDDPLWHDCQEVWPAIEVQLEKYATTTTAIIIEPIVQAAAGMLIYSRDFLNKVAAWAKSHNIHIIADEIMTGFGRTGKMLACDYANFTPDFICLSKGLTSGCLPLSTVITTDEIYQIFYGDYGTGKDFLHSHTHSGNALAASVAIETLKILKEQHLCVRANHIGKIMLQNMQEIAAITGKLANVRGIGAVVAADLINNPATPRLAYEVYQQAVKLGALLRPLGNTLYWVPPLNIEHETLEQLKQITLAAITAKC